MGLPTVGAVFVCFFRISFVKNFVIHFVMLKKWSGANVWVKANILI